VDDNSQHRGRLCLYCDLRRQYLYVIQ
jgi:hypothetical protein